MFSPCPFSSQHMISSTHHLVFPLRLSRIREVKMIPRSMWRQRADSSSTRDKEKESKRSALGKIEERNRPTPLPRACPPCKRNKQRRMQTAQSNQPSRRSLNWNQGTLIFRTQNSKPVRDQRCGKTTRSSISKTIFTFLNSTLSGFYFAILVMFIRCLLVCLFLCEFMLETLRTMFDLSVGG